MKQKILILLEPISEHLSENNIPKFNDSSNSHADENVDDEIKNSEEYQMR